MPNSKSQKQDQTFTSYDELPYESYSFAYTRPEHLRTIGVLFGMNPPEIETARVLELGGASGGNVINFAATYPKSYTLSVDLSKVEIEQGQKRVKDLKLKNIELKAMSIADLDDSAGKFDYIICHGVFSWVPDFVRDKILEISKNFLSPNGIAFISYNTLPGWNMVNNIRDMMMFHADLFQDTQSRLQQSKLFLNFVTEALENSPTPYAKFLKENTENLMKQEDSYLRHEYLSEENTQFYFYQFMEMARAKGLSYLGESNFHTMFLGNLPQKAAEKLAGIQDIVRTEQYMDFIQNKRFRCTLLCHETTAVKRDISPQHLNQFYMTSNLAPEKVLSEAELQNSFEAVKFFFNGNKDNFISTSSPAMKAVFYAIAENNGNPLRPADLLKLAHKKLKNISMADLENEFNQNIGRLIFGGYIKLFAEKPKVVYSISEKPKVAEVSRYQADNCHTRAWTMNQVNDLIPIQPFEQHIIRMMDGKNTVEQIKEELLSKFKTGVLTASEGEKKIEDAGALSTIAAQTVDATLEKFRINYMLVA